MIKTSFSSILIKMKLFKEKIRIYLFWASNEDLKIQLLLAALLVFCKFLLLVQDQSKYNISL